MTKIIKLTSKQNCTVRKNSSPDLPINEEIKIPLNHKGELYIRKRLGNKGINVPKSPFHELWEGKPEICLIHSGANDVDLVAGEEIGELHISYDPPSPLYGKYFELSKVFGFRSVDGAIQVATEDGKLYSCSHLLKPITANEFERIAEAPDSWNVFQTAPFEANFIMVDYEYLRYLEHIECKPLHDMLLSERLRLSFSQVNDIFKETPDMQEQLSKILAETVKETTKEEPVQQGTIQDHAHVHNGGDFVDIKDWHPKPMSPIDFGKSFKFGCSSSEESEVKSTDEKVNTFKVSKSFKFTNDGKVINVWLGEQIICKSSQYTINFDGKDEGFVYDASEFELSIKPQYVPLNKNGERYDLVLIDPVFKIDNPNDLCSTLIKLVKTPTESMREDFGYLGALIFANLPDMVDLIVSKNHELSRSTNLLTFIIKALIKQRLRKGKTSGKMLKKYLQMMRTLSNAHMVPTPFITTLKRNNNCWTSPLKVIDALAEHHTEDFENLFLLLQKK